MEVNVEFQEPERKKKIKRIIAREGLRGPLISSLLLALRINKKSINKNKIIIHAIKDYYKYCKIKGLSYGKPNVRGSEVKIRKNGSLVVFLGSGHGAFAKCVYDEEGKIRKIY